jgi:hypothetical protein
MSGYLINPRGNTFYFTFPKGFFPEEVVKKYEPFIKRQTIPFDTIGAYINSTIQSVSFPSLTIDGVEQTRMLGKRISYQSATPVQDLFNKDIAVTFKMVDGYINYFIVLETILHHLNFKTGDLYLPNLPLRMMDGNGNIIVSVQFKLVTVTSVSEISLSYTANTPQATNFSLGMKANYIDLDLEIERKI